MKGPGFLFLSDQFHSPVLAIVKLTMKITSVAISFWPFLSCSSHNIAVFGLVHVYI